MAFQSARLTRIASAFTNANAGDSTFGTVAAAITTASTTAPATTRITVTNMTDGVAHALRDQGYEVRLISGTFGGGLSNTNSVEVDWSAPTDA